MNKELLAVMDDIAIKVFFVSLNVIIQVALVLLFIADVRVTNFWTVITGVALLFTFFSFKPKYTLKPRSIFRLKLMSDRESEVIKT